MSAELKNEFSWSNSRDATFRECPRRYYFRYYGSWGGWSASAEPRTRKLYVLKQLRTRHMWAGAAVHECIKASLRDTRRGVEPMSAEDAVEAALSAMRTEYLASKRRDYWLDPKGCGLFEHEYGLAVPAAAWKEIAAHVARCLRAFYASDLYGRIRAMPADAWLDVEDFSSFDLDGTKVHVVLDFSCREGDGVAIWDWKTGKAGGARNDRQLACYGLYAVERWGVAPERVRAAELNLASGKVRERRLTSSDLDSVRAHIRASASDMRSLLDDPEANSAREERFPFAANDRSCRFCNFRSACPRFGPVE
jgi:hypothetical protein